MMLTPSPSPRSEVMKMTSLQRPDAIILALGLGGASLLYLLSTVAQVFVAPAPGTSLSWTLALCLNLLGYATILLPGAAVISYVRKTNYLETAPLSVLQPLVSGIKEIPADTRLFSNIQVGQSM